MTTASTVKKRKGIPNIEYQKATRREKIYAIIFIMIYALMNSGYVRIFIDENHSVISIIGIHVAVFLCALFVIKDRLKKDFGIFLENFKEYMKYVFSRLILFIIINYIVSIIIFIISTSHGGTGISVNEQAVQEYPSWFLVPVTVIWAPIVEETIYRWALRLFLKNDMIFIIVSSLSFGLIHVTKEVDMFNLVTNLIPYAMGGAFLALLYAKSKNIITNISAHSLWNTMNVLLNVL